MYEPLSVSVHACHWANVGPETNVLVMGAGPIGLITLLAPRAFEAPRIVVADVNDHRLSVAKALSAHEIVKVSTNIEEVAEEVAKIKEAMGTRVYVSFDCAGFNKTMATALSATGSGGKVCLVGMAQRELTLPLTSAAARSSKVDVKPLITHRFGFSQKEVEKAFETSAGGGNAIKVIFNL
ncbi:hypothetical protein L3X38_001190 [Prunus dulcis]|uniref:Alcohol dehydrogenase-like C-terminal domain-containing protein n=1 Tax=Prunus dulcis TaxID=3755 RepID=A0AAD4WRH6_PRUDU|nr:hypothetical protein L3X38_001190 [Prunus dulcis]